MTTVTLYKRKAWNCLSHVTHNQPMVRKGKEFMLLKLFNVKFHSVFRFCLYSTITSDDNTTLNNLLTGSFNEQTVNEMIVICWVRKQSSYWFSYKCVKNGSFGRSDKNNAAEFREIYKEATPNRKTFIEATF